MIVDYTGISRDHRDHARTRARTRRTVLVWSSWSFTVLCYSVETHTLTKNIPPAPLDRDFITKCRGVGRRAALSTDASPLVRTCNEPRCCLRRRRRRMLCRTRHIHGMMPARRPPLSGTDARKEVLVRRTKVLQACECSRVHGDTSHLH